MVYRLTLSYRGTLYAGWQRQNNALAVQQVVEEGLSDLLQERIHVIGAGRTDAGVHARGQEAHFGLQREFPLRGLAHGLNNRLPEEIRVMAAHRMGDGFHAQRSAAAKEYRYRLSRAPVLSPLEGLFVVPVDGRIDGEALVAAAQLLVGRHDFTAFALAGGSHRHAVRRIFDARWVESGQDLTLVLRGEGFLRGMVRSLVGTLIEVGLGRRTLGAFGALLEGAPRSAAGPTAPARGLTLERVEYPEQWRPLASFPEPDKSPPGDVVT